MKIEIDDRLKERVFALIRKNGCESARFGMTMNNPISEGATPIMLQLFFSIREGELILGDARIYDSQKVIEEDEKFKEIFNRLL